MKAGCALSLGTFAVAGGAYYFWLRGRFDPPGDWIAALVGGFLMMMVVGLLQNAHMAWRDPGVLRRAQEGTPPEDGRPFAASGPIRPLGRPLQAPFSGTECIAYDYDVYQRVRRDSGTTESNQYGGFHLTPSAIDTPAGRIKLLSWSTLDEFPKSRPEGEEAYARAAAPPSRCCWRPWCRCCCWCRCSRASAAAR